MANSLFPYVGTLHPGDEIREINGVNVAEKSVENLQAILVSYTIITIPHSAFDSSHPEIWKHFLLTLLVELTGRIYCTI